jgi:predicted TIM-barrel fold metal-dependent hydrolase
MTVVDAWIQHPTPEFLAQPMFASLRRWMGLTTVPDAIPLAFTLGALDAAGVERALLTAWWGPAGPMLSNDQVADWCAEAPDRLVPVASVDLRDPMAGVRELRRCADRGFKAVRQLPWLWDLPPDDRRYYPLYAACVDLGLPFCLQVGHTGPLMPSAHGRPIPHLDHVALDFPELVIVAGHIGYPWTDEMIALATKFDNVYIDTSAYKPSRYPPQLVSFMRKHGRRKVLFGSNWPMIAPADCMRQLDELGLDEASRALFLSGNAERVFGLG